MLENNTTTHNLTFLKFWVVSANKPTFKLPMSDEFSCDVITFSKLPGTLLRRVLGPNCDFQHISILDLY